MRNTYEGKPYRRMLMETFGASVTPSPSDKTEAGRALRERFPDTTGSLGMAISEAIEEAVKDPDASYSLGSVLNHVALHQTIIGQEALAQLAKFDEGMPDHLFACAVSQGMDPKQAKCQAVSDIKNLQHDLCSILSQPMVSLGPVRLS